MVGKKETLLLLDNNVIGPWMRNEDFYKRLYDHTLKASGGAAVRLLPTSTGLLEFLGIKPGGPPDTVRTSRALSDELRRKDQAGEENFADVVQNIKADLYSQYVVWLTQQPKFSLATISAAFNTKFQSLPLHGKRAIDALFGSSIDKKTIDILHSRIAHAFVQQFHLAELLPANDDFERTVDASFYVDLVDFHADERNLPMVRGVERAWLGFSARLLEEFRTGNHTIPITLAELEQNIETATQHFSFRAGEEYLDLEFIHRACLGSHWGGTPNPVIVATAERRSTTLYRTALYRSFVRMSFEQTEEIRGAESKFQPEPGRIIFIDKPPAQSPLIAAEHLVRNIPGLFIKATEIVLDPDNYP